MTHKKHTLSTITLFLFFFLLAQCRGYQIVASGSTLPGPMYSKLLFAFNIIGEKNMTMDYEATDSETGKGMLMNDRTLYDFIGTDAPFTADEMEAYPYVYQLPILGSTIAPVFNIPGYDRTLTLTTHALEGIFSGRIRNWRHPELVVTNPGLSAVADENITVAIRHDSGNVMFSEGLSLLDSDWASSYGTFEVWPASILDNMYYERITGSNIALSVYVAETPYTVSFLPSPFVVDYRIQYMKVEKENGEVLSPFSELTFPDDLHLDELNTANLVGKSPEWPMAAFTYIAFDKNRNDNCAKRTEILKYIYWGSLRKEDISSEGYFSITDSMRRDLDTSYFSIECDGNQAISPVFLNNYSAIPIAVLCVSLLIGVIVFIVMIWFFQGINIPIEILVTISFFIGAELMIGGTVFWFIEPSTTIICQLRVWLTLLGLMIMNGVSVSRGWQLITISQMKITSKVNQKLIFTISVITTIVVEIGFLLVWNILDPMVSTINPLSTVDLILEHTCVSEHQAIWLTIQSCLLGALTLWGIYTVYSTWKLTKHYDPRFNLFTLYFSSIMIMAMIFFLTFADGESQLYLTVCVGTIMLVIGFWVPHAVQYFKVYYSTKSHTKSLSKEGSRTRKKRMGDSFAVQESSNSNRAKKHSHHRPPSDSDQSETI